MSQIPNQRAIKAVMGHVFAEARVFGRRSARVRFLVDTGATYSMISPTLARRIGAAMLPGKYRVRLADGRVRNLKASAMGIELEKRQVPMTALLVEDPEPLLGVETLEALGLRVDPVKRKLEPTRRAALLLVSTFPALPSRLKRRQGCKLRAATRRRLR